MLKCACYVYESLDRDHDAEDGLEEAIPIDDGTEAYLDQARNCCLRLLFGQIGCSFYNVQRSSTSTFKPLATSNFQS
jgi:hypothetical protein